jgi:hypothetical protein
VGRCVFGVDLEGEAAKRTSESAICSEDSFAIASENRKDAAERFLCGGESRVYDHGAEKVEIAFENGTQESFFAVEEVIEAAGVYLCVRQQLCHAGAGEASIPKQKAGGVNESVAG